MPYLASVRDAHFRSCLGRLPTGVRNTAALPAAYPIYAPVLRYHGPALNSVLDKTIAGVAVVVDAVLLLQFLDEA